MFRRRYTMLETRFGVEINLTGFTRKKVTETPVGFFGTKAEYSGTTSETYIVKDRDDRTSKLIMDNAHSRIP